MSEFKKNPKKRVQVDRKKKLDGLRGSLKGAQKEEKQQEKEFSYVGTSTEAITCKI